MAGYEPSPQALFNDRPAIKPIQEEKPEHLRIIQLKYAGRTNKEIGVFTGYSPIQVANVLRQPWARRRLLSMFAEDGESFAQLLESEAKESILTLAELRDTAQSESVRATSAINLADRFFGKPTQRTEHYDAGKAPSLKDMEALDQEIARTQEDLKRMEGSR